MRKFEEIIGKFPQIKQNRQDNDKDSIYVEHLP